MRLGNGIFHNGKAIPGNVFDVLNKVGDDHVSNHYLCKNECYDHNHLITKVQVDGVMVATPTGITTYSTSARSSIVRPNVPCILFTTICFHSLSFHLMIIPDSTQLELNISGAAQSNSWVLFERKRWKQLSRGDFVPVYMSKQPLPTINECDQTNECFQESQICAAYDDDDDGIRSILHMLMISLLRAESGVKKLVALRKSLYSDVGNGQVFKNTCCEEDQQKLHNIVPNKSTTSKQWLGI